MDFQDEQDCKADIRRINELLSSGIFGADNRSLLQQSAFIELMICLRDLMHKTEKYSKRIAFTDEVITNEDVKDITDAIKVVRDACCHIKTKKRWLDDRKNRGAYLVVYGKGTLMRINDLEIK